MIEAPTPSPETGSAPEPDQKEDSMISRSTVRPFLVVLLALVIPVLVGCSSGGSVVQATPQNPADLPMPNQPTPTFE